MKEGLIAICCIFIVFLGCKEPESQPSIAQDRMVEILVDVHLVEASLLGFSEEQKDSLSQFYYHQIYEIHSISEDSFLTEMDYLKRHPDYLEKTYAKVLEVIDKREAELK